MRSRFNYHGLPITEAQQFDTELVNRIIFTLRLSKAVLRQRLKTFLFSRSYPDIAI